MTNVPQKNVNSIQFGKEIVHVNHVLIPGSPILKEKKPRGLFFFSRSKTHRETSELRNSSELPRKFSGIFGNSRTIFGNSGTLQEENLTPLAQKELAGITFLLSEPNQESLH